MKKRFFFIFTLLLSIIVLFNNAWADQFDVYDDNRIGLEEAINALQVTSGIRSEAGSLAYDFTEYYFGTNSDYQYSQKYYVPPNVYDSNFQIHVTDETIESKNVICMYYDGGYWNGWKDYAQIEEIGIRIIGWYNPGTDYNVWLEGGYVQGKTSMQPGDIWQNFFIANYSTSQWMYYRNYHFVGTQDVTVPAGTFTDCLKIEVHRKNGFIYVGYYAKDIGIVKEIELHNDGAGLIWELVSANIDGVEIP